MAQGSKSRIVIWTIVGILVVVAVVLLLTRPKTGGMTTDPTVFATRMEGRLQKLETRVAKSGLAPDVAQTVADEIGKARTLLQELQGMAGSDQAQIKTKTDAANDAYQAAKKLLREATGKDEPDEGGK
jgi:hypothetical protein